MSLKAIRFERYLWLCLRFNWKWTTQRKLFIRGVKRSGNLKYEDINFTMFLYPLEWNRIDEDLDRLFFSRYSQIEYN